jgi:cytochrome c553
MFSKNSDFSQIMTSIQSVKTSSKLVVATSFAVMQLLAMNDVVANTAKAVATPPDVAHGAAIMGQVCAACHGADGNNATPENPKLAGQHAKYIVKQLTNFKKGERKNAVMNGFAAALSDQDMKDIGAYLNEQKIKGNTARRPDLKETGERIYRYGIASKQVPACAACHGPNGAGMAAKFPRLGGQHAAYTEKQMLAFQSGERSNGPMMMKIAKGLNDIEIKAVSDYIQGLK